MRSILRWLDYLADLAFLPVLWAMVLAANEVFLFLGSVHIITSLIFLSICLPLWMYLRTMPRLVHLAGNHALRSELAATPLSAGSFIRSRILRPLITSSLVPLLMTLPGITLVLGTEFPDTIFLFVLFGLLSVYTFVGLSICLWIGSWTFCRILLPGVSPSMKGWLLTGGFLLSCLLIVLFHLSRAIVVFRFGVWDTDILLNAAFVGMGPLLLLLAWRNRRSCCKLFYTCEAKPSEDPR